MNPPPLCMQRIPIHQDCQSFPKPRLPNISKTKIANLLKVGNLSAVGKLRAMVKLRTVGNLGKSLTFIVSKFFKNITIMNLMHIEIFIFHRLMLVIHHIYIEFIAILFRSFQDHLIFIQSCYYTYLSSIICCQS